MYTRNFEAPDLKRKPQCPMGLALVEGDELWVGNFGDRAHQQLRSGEGNFIETLMRADGTPLQFDGLWDLLRRRRSLFTAGIADEEHGLLELLLRIKISDRKNWERTRLCCRYAEFVPARECARRPGEG